MEFRYFLSLNDSSGLSLCLKSLKFIPFRWYNGKFCLNIINEDIYFYIFFIGTLYYFAKLIKASKTLTWISIA